MIDKKILKEEVIYEKVYSEEILEETEIAMSEQKVLQKENKHLAIAEIIDEIYRDIEYVPLPERIKTAELFIKTAIEISETYELDVKIVQRYSHISVDYYFNSAGSMGFLKKIIQFADDISFFTNIMGYEIVMSIDYYTHAEYRHGRQIQP